EVRTLYDDRYLYIAFECDEQDIEALKAQTVIPNAIWMTDCVEVFIDRGGPEQSIYHFIVNPRGDTYDWHQRADWRSRRLSGPWRSAASIGRDSWTVEIAIPFHTLDCPPGDVPSFGINFCREKYTPPAE